MRSNLSYLLKSFLLYQNILDCFGFFGCQYCCCYIRQCQHTFSNYQARDGIQNGMNTEKILWNCYIDDHNPHFQKGIRRYRHTGFCPWIWILRYTDIRRFLKWQIKECCDLTRKIAWCVRARTEIIGNGSKRAEKHFALMLLDFSREIELL